jgi:hypothetical protein
MKLSEVNYHQEDKLSLPVSPLLLYYVLVPHPDPEHFFIQERDSLRLITPKAATVFADHVWTPENSHYRSRIETLSGKTVS